MTATVTDTTEFTRDWEQWHAEHEARRADKHGFLAITGLYWLDRTPQRFPDAPGAWSSGENGIVVELDEGEQLELDGSVLRGRHVFGRLDERDSIYPAWGDAVIEVARRAGNDIVRPRHPDAPVLAAYRGTDSYPPSPKWAITARYEPFEEPRPTTVGSVVDGLQHVYDAPGALHFDVDGEPQSLTAFPGAGGGLMVLFTDATSGVTTYPANRSLSLAAPDADGTVTLDFNRATNLPCAYTTLATCPLPPAENHLGVAVQAGEKSPS